MKLIFSVILAACMYLPAHAGEKSTIAINGMSCSSCAQKVKTELNSMKGVKVISIDPDHGQAVVEVEDGVNITTESFKEAVKNAGFNATSVTKLENKKAAKKN